jgi:Protein of unknown function (DUF2971)
VTADTSQNGFMGLTAEELFRLNVFHSFAFGRIQKALQNNMKFVHYTTADTAMRIFENQQIWMRKSSCMNDFMEIEHGFECLNLAYKKHKDYVQATLGSLFSEIPEKLEQKINELLPYLRTDTYIACVSEHGDENTGDEEDRIGRLSMWRAYGGTTGVAIVINNGPFLRPSSALNAYTSPVAYLGVESFEVEFLQLIAAINENKSQLKLIGEDVIVDSIFEAFRSAILCTKHPGFREEREWRVIYCPTYEKSDRLIADVQTISGTPQPIFKLPLKNVPEEGFYGAEIPELVDRIIIGPTHFPYAIKEAIVSRLKLLGVTDAEKKVIVSDIPLRN